MPSEVVSATKYLTMCASLLTLALETSVTGTSLDLIAFGPSVGVGCTFYYCKRTLSASCRQFLNADLKGAGKDSVRE